MGSYLNVGAPKNTSRTNEQNLLSTFLIYRAFQKCCFLQGAEMKIKGSFFYRFVPKFRLYILNIEVKIRVFFFKQF